jgi:hypothetical protein
MMFIPVVIFIYLIYINLMPFGGAVSYYIDVGADDLQGTAKLTGPMDRISEPDETNGITFRNLNQGLVYFSLNSPYLKSKGKVTVKVIFRDNFPQGQKFMLGAKNNESWSYAWKDIYVPFYETLKSCPSVNIGNKRVIMINGSAISSFDEIPEGSVIAANTEIDQIFYEENVKDAGNKNLSIDATLRGSHTFYTYVDDGALNLSISKQDLNWYNGTDELNIEVYSFKDELIGNGTVPDDGDQNKSNVLGNVQEANLSFSNLENGVYRINLIGGGDVLIRKIEFDKNKLVVEGRIFLVGSNPAYFKGKKAAPVEIYFKNLRNSTMKFQTYHSSGLQNITVKNRIAKVVNINKTQKLFILSPGSSEEINTLISEKGNVIIDSMDYFSFTRDSYFTPKKFKIVDMNNDLAWIKDNVDYVVLDYKFPEGDEWKAINASWDVDELYIKDNTLSFSLNAPHLGKEEFRNYTIPVDRIDIMVKIPPVWERIR